MLTIFDTVNTCSAIFYTSVVYQLFIFINQISYYLGVHCKQYIKRFLVYTVCCMSKVWFILSSNLVGNKAWTSYHSEKELWPVHCNVSWEHSNYGWPLKIVKMRILTIKNVTISPLNFVTAIGYLKFLINSVFLFMTVYLL